MKAGMVLSSGFVMKILLIVVAEQYLHPQGLFWFLCCPAPEELGLWRRGQNQASPPNNPRDIPYHRALRSPIKKEGGK